MKSESNFFLNVPLQDVQQTTRNKSDYVRKRLNKIKNPFPSRNVKRTVKKQIYKNNAISVRQEKRAL